MPFDSQTQASIDKVFGKPVDAPTDTTPHLLRLDTQVPSLKPIINDLKLLLSPKGLNQEQQKRLHADLESRATEAQNSGVVSKDYTFKSGFLGFKRLYNEGYLIRILGELRDSYMGEYARQTQTPPHE